MNQILQTQKPSKNSGPVEIGKVVKFFAIAIAIFGIILIGIGIYMVVSKNDSEPGVGTVDENIEPEVNIEKQEEDILLDVKHTVAISNITYNWNSEEAQTIEGNNRTSIQETISLPFGTNTLYVTITDINGKQTTFQKEYVVDGDGKPVIELTLTQDYQIKITVQDAVGLKYITYTWNNGEKTRVDANIDNLKLIEKTVDIPLGQNTLVVDAINTSDVITTKELEVKGVKRPDISITKDGDYLIIRAEDEKAIKVVTYTLNGQRYQINFGEKKVVQHRQEIPKGESYIEVTAENVDGGIREIKGKCIN